MRDYANEGFDYYALRALLKYKETGIADIEARRFFKAFGLIDDNGQLTLDGHKALQGFSEEWGKKGEQGGRLQLYSDAVNTDAWNYSQAGSWDKSGNTGYESYANEGFDYWPLSGLLKYKETGVAKPEHKRYFEAFGLIDAKGEITPEGHKALQGFSEEWGRNNPSGKSSLGGRQQYYNSTVMDDAWNYSQAGESLDSIYRDITDIALGGEAVSVFCPDCHQSVYGWDGLERHYLRGWCKVAGKLNEEETRGKINQELSARAREREMEYQEQEAYDRRHNLGAYSY